MDMSDAIQEAYANAPDVPFFDTFEITHSDFTDSIRVVVSWRELVTNRGRFIPVPGLSFTLAETTGSVRGQVKITLPGLPAEVRTRIRGSVGTRNPVRMLYRQYLEGQMDPDVEMPAPFTLTNISETPTGVEATAMAPDLIGAYLPRRLMTVQTCPGLRM